jgi:multicomponent Na+:H+ antiporter subunit B
MIPGLIHVATLLTAVTAFAVIRVRDLFGLIALLAVYSLLLATLFTLMGAGDVALTEAVVGASVSVVFLMALMWWIDPYEVNRLPAARRFWPWIPAGALGALLTYGVMALPPFGDPDAPPMRNVSPYYIENSYADMATPNVVAAVLADYRSLDTLVEAAVVFAAALACLLILLYRDDPAVR